jgi:hypothetical protein
MGRAGFDMAEPCILIDDAGRERQWPGAQRGAAFGYRDPDFDFPAYAVRNLGHVMIAARHGTMRLRMRPVFVGHRTLDAVMAHLASHRPSRVAISYFDTAWHHEVGGDAHAAATRLHAIIEASARRDGSQPFVAARRNIAGVLHTASEPLAPVLRRWLDGAPPEGLAAFLASCGLYDRTMIAEREGDTGRFVFRHSGQSIRLYGRSWNGTVVGRHVQDQPDPAYGAWIDAACRRVDECQVPRYELVTAQVDRPDAAARQWRYERLMLPWPGADGRRLVLSISLRDKAGSGQARPV